MTLASQLAGDLCTKKLTQIQNYEMEEMVDD